MIAYNAGLEESGENEALLRYQTIAEMLGIGGGTPKAAVHGLIRHIRNLIKRIRIPAYVTELSVESETFVAAIPEMMEKALKDNCTATNPRVPAREELEYLYKKLCKGGSV